jgi:hypothetical protein
LNDFSQIIFTIALTRIQHIDHKFEFKELELGQYVRQNKNKHLPGSPSELFTDSRGMFVCDEPPLKGVILTRMPSIPTCAEFAAVNQHGLLVITLKRPLRFGSCMCYGGHIYSTSINEVNTA